MAISQVILPMAARLVPSVPTTFGSQFVSSSPSSSFLYMSPDITLFVAPVSKSALIFVSFMDDRKTVPSVEPVIPSLVEAFISHRSSLSETVVR